MGSGSHSQNGWQTTPSSSKQPNSKSLTTREPLRSSQFVSRNASAGPSTAPRPVTRPGALNSHRLQDTGFQSAFLHHDSQSMIDYLFVIDSGNGQVDGAPRVLVPDSEGDDYLEPVDDAFDFDGKS